MNTFQIFMHNLFNSNKIIKCPKCGLIQPEIDWDYQKCKKCKYYIYDYR